MEFQKGLCGRIAEIVQESNLPAGRQGRPILPWGLSKQRAFDDERNSVLSYNGDTFLLLHPRSDTPERFHIHAAQKRIEACSQHPKTTDDK